MYKPIGGDSPPSTAQTAHRAPSGQQRKRFSIMSSEDSSNIFNPD
jgi:hypothetical protein